MATFWQTLGEGLGSLFSIGKTKNETITAQNQQIANLQGQLQAQQTMNAQNAAGGIGKYLPVILVGMLALFGFMFMGSSGGSSRRR